ncbi:MAG: hypothetical protein VCF07_19380, partial [Nitrospinota bacterium]
AWFDDWARLSNVPGQGLPPRFEKSKSSSKLSPNDSGPIDLDRLLADFKPLAGISLSQISTNELLTICDEISKKGGDIPRIFRVMVDNNDDPSYLPKNPGIG